MSKLYYDSDGKAKKYCPRCNATYDEPEKVFFKDNETSDKLSTNCKVCHHNMKVKRASSQPIPEKKICTICSKEYDNPIKDFGRNKWEPDGLNYACKTCCNKAGKEYRQEHGEKLRAYHREYEKRPEYQAKRKPYDAARKQTPEYKAINRASRKRVYAKNPEKEIEKVMRRRAMIFQNGVDPVDYTYIKQRDGMFCYLCHQDILPDQETNYDHVWPLSRGGPHTVDNVRVTHEYCNQRKGNRFLSELPWYHET